MHDKPTASVHRPILPAAPRLIARFWGYVDIGVDVDCWPWTRSVHPRCGYGSFGWGDETRPTHRVAYALHYGVDPGPSVVRHDCDNPPCCNPHHLRLGTQRDNMHDAIRRGRLRAPRGEAHRSAKLTEEDVRVIRAEYRPRVVTAPSLAARFGVSEDAVKDIVTRKAWSHID